jgi:hypothetical protein
MIRQQQVVRTFTALFALAVSTTSFAAPLVDTDFEPPLNSVGNLNGQPSTGPNPWTSLFGVINNGGFFLGTQSAQYGNNMPPNALHDHSYVDLGPVVIPPGQKLRATVDIYMDPSQPSLMTGLAAYANGHSNQLGYFGATGGGSKLGLDGTNNSTALLGHITNPVDSGWNNVTTYLFNGAPFMHNGFNITTHTDVAGGPNIVSDIALFSMNMGTSTQVGIGYYDNYKVEILVPEPATALLLVLAAAAGCGRLMRTRAGRSKTGRGPDKTF